MTTLTFDPVVEQICTDVKFDRNTNKLYLQNTEIKGENFQDWKTTLAAQLYMTYHVGHEYQEQGAEALLNDLVLEELIITNTPEMFRMASGPVISVEKDDADSVTGVYTALSGLKVLVPAERIVELSNATVDFRTRTLRPRLSAGFMFFIGSDYRPKSPHLLRIYRYAEQPEDILPIWDTLTRFIVQEHLPIRMKMLSRLHEYPRRDALVLYLNEEAWPHLPEICDIVTESAEPSATDPAPRFAKTLTANVMYAWEPLDTESPQGKESFGQQRARRIVEGLMADLEQDTSDFSNLHQVLTAANIDPTAIYRNLDSPAITF